MTRRPYTWWVLGDSFGGAEIQLAATAPEARQARRGTFICVFELNGMSHSAAIRAASAAHVHVIAGRLTEGAATEIMFAWEKGDLRPAIDAGRDYRRDPHWRPPYPPMPATTGNDPGVAEGVQP